MSIKELFELIGDEKRFKEPEKMGIIINNFEGKCVVTLFNRIDSKIRTVSADGDVEGAIDVLIHAIKRANYDDLNSPGIGFPKQEPLGEQFEKVLYDNLNELY